MRGPPLFRDRERPAQILVGGVVPFVFGAAVGIVLGVSSGGYWGLSAIAAVGGFLVGFEHEDGKGGARRGLIGGILFASGILLAHVIAGTKAKVSLGSVPAVLILIDAFFGVLLGAFGGRTARIARERQADRPSP